MIYALWDKKSNDLVVEYTDERSALDVVLESLNEHGAAITEELALEVEDEQGNVALIAHGRDLIEHARHRLASARLAG